VEEHLLLGDLALGLVTSNVQVSSHYFNQIQILRLVGSCFLLEEIQRKLSLLILEIRVTLSSVH